MAGNQGQIARSAKGQVVDFDLLRIKNQIAATPAPVHVQVRESFIEQRLKRRVKKIVEPIKTENDKSE